MWLPCDGRGQAPGHHSSFLDIPSKTYERSLEIEAEDSLLVLV